MNPKIVIQLSKYADDQERDDHGRWSNSGGIHDRISAYSTSMSGDQLRDKEFSQAAKNLASGKSPSNDLERGLDQTRTESQKGLQVDSKGRVELYRGVSSDQINAQGGSHRVNLPVDHLSSWSSDPAVAKIYADNSGGKVVRALVPAKQVAWTSSHPAYGNAKQEFGDQKEHVVMSNGKIKGSFY